MKKTSFCPRPKSAEAQFIEGKPFIGCSISEQRLDHLNCLSKQNKTQQIKVSVRDCENDSWTKWTSIAQQNSYLMNNAHEIHRTLCDNEILIESDYPDYKDNVEASKFIGKMLEEKGYIAHYYFSGSKSIHIHIFFNFDLFLTANRKLLESIGRLHISEDDFLRSFIVYLRELMISCWNTNARDFDRGLINPKHLIRSELSRNKLGFKTFLCYDYNLIPDEPKVCNFETTLYPEIATACEPNGEIQHELKISEPKNIDNILEEYIVYKHELIAKEKELKRKWARQIAANNNFIERKKLRPCVDFILSDKFKEKGDGFKRGMFILVNELLRIHSQNEVFEIIYDWNLRMGNPINEVQIDYRVNNPREYKFSNKYIMGFLKEVGFETWQ